MKRERERESERGREFGCGLFSACYASTSCWVFSHTLITDDRGREASDEAGDEVEYKAGRESGDRRLELEIDFPISIQIHKALIAI